MRRAVHALCLFGLLAVAVATPTAWADDPYVVELVAKDGRFQPAELVVPPARRIKIVIRNAGDSPIEFESLSLRKEKVLAPGAHSFVVIAPLRPGSYDFFDEFHPDTGRGRLIVKPRE